MYKLTSGWPQHIESGAFVNPDTNHEYLAWLAEGNVPEPADQDYKSTMNGKLDIELQKYNDDLQYLRNQFTAADLAGGPLVEVKKEQIRASLATRKAEYLSKVAQIKAEG